MYTRIHYDRDENRVHLWEDNNGVPVYHSELVPFEYFIYEDMYTRSNPNLDRSWKDIYGVPVIRNVVTSPQDVKNVSNLMEKSQIPTCNTQLNPSMKYLFHRYGTGNLIPKVENFNTAYWDIEVASTKGFPYADKAEFPINAICVKFSKTNEVHVFALKNSYTGKYKTFDVYHTCESQTELLQRFIDVFRENRVDILTGWNSRLFDVPYFINRCKMLGVRAEGLSPIGKLIPRVDKESGEGFYDIAGLNHLDSMDLYKKFTFTMQPSYSLQAIGMLECDEGKIDFEGTINTIWQTDWNTFIDYNVQDVLLLEKIEKKMQHIPLAINIAYSSRIPIENVTSTLQVVTGDLMMMLADPKVKIAVPDRNRNDLHEEEYEGAYVMAKEGYYEDTCSFDLQSMYPWLGIQYNISPETLINMKDISKYKPEDVIRTPVDGIYYDKRTVGVLPRAFKKGFDLRKRFKDKMKLKQQLDMKVSFEEMLINAELSNTVATELLNEISIENQTEAYYAAMQLVYKIKINSYYGALGNRFFCLYNITNAKAITLSGQHLIKYLSNSANDYLKKNWSIIARGIYGIDGVKNPENDLVILIDTDSNYIHMKQLMESVGFTYNKDVEGLTEYKNWVNNLNSKFFVPFWDHILDKYAAQFNVKNVMYFKREKICTKMIIVAKKKYLYYMIDKEGKFYGKEKLDIVGIEIISSATPVFCRPKLEDTVKIILDTGDERAAIKHMIQTKKEFMQLPKHKISRAMGVGSFNDWFKNVNDKGVIDWTNGPIFERGIPYHVRGAINYNYLIDSLGLPLIPITGGAKVKMVYVNGTANDLGCSLISYIGNWSEEFDNYFTINYDKQWSSTYESIIQRIFDAIGWGPIRLMEMIDMPGAQEIEEWD